jgi:hypothetical protein
VNCYIYCLAGNGTTVWCCGGGSIVRESIYLGLITHGPVILAPYWSISQQIHYGWARQRFLPSFAYPRQTITWLRPLRRPTAWERIPSPPDGVIWNRSSGVVTSLWFIPDWVIRGGYALCREATPHDLLPWVLAIAHMVCWESKRSQAAVG